MTVYDSFTAWFNNFLSWIGGCLGCTTCAPLDDPQKGWQSQGLLVTSFSEDFWGSSIGEIDIPIGLLQRSFTSLSTSNLSLHSDLASRSTNSLNEFVNKGLLFWTKVRLQWIGAIKSSDHQASVPSISAYDGLVSAKGGVRRPIPLGEVVDFLADRWEQDELYD